MGGAWLWGGWPLWWWQMYYPSYYSSFVQPMYVEINNQYPSGPDAQGSNDDDDDQPDADDLGPISSSKVKVLRADQVPGRNAKVRQPVEYVDDEQSNAD
jgi:hypothetical protein